MIPNIQLLLALLLPLVAAVVIALLHRRPNLREAATLITGGLLLSNMALLAPSVIAGGRPGLELVEVLPGLSLAFRLEPLGLLFALLSAGLWLLTSVYAIGYMRGHGESNQTRFYVFFALAISATQGVALAGNLFTLFVCYEILTVSTYPLVTHLQTPVARRGGRTYLGVLMGASIGLLLPALALTWLWAGTLDFQPGGILMGKVDGPLVGVLLALFAFGTAKAALMPLHRWLPAAMVAPTPVSALLHAVAVVKSGVFAIMKILVYIFGLDLLNGTGASEWLMYLAGFTIIAASLIALTKDNLKARLAYSTIGQLAYIVLGAALANDLGMLGAGYHIVAHALGKITLFLCAGAILIALHKTRVSELNGIGHRMPLTMGAFTIGTLTIVGLPPMGGAWSKWYLILGALEAGQYFAVAVILLGSLLSLGYLGPIVVNAFFRPPDGEAGVKEAPAACVVPLLLTATGCLALFWFPDPILRLLRLLGGG